MNSLRSQAIVLRRTNYGEADRILQLLTSQGKRSVMARGVRKEKSRLSGGIELFALSEVVIASGRGGLGVLTQARLIKFYGHIIEDYDRLQFGYEVIKLVSMASESIDGPEWFNVLNEVLESLNETEIDLQLTQTWFYLRYAALNGFELSLWNDIYGKKLLSGLNYRYDITEKGLYQIESGNLNESHIKLLRLLSTKPLKTVVQVGGIEDIMSDCLVVTRQHAI